MSTFFWHIFLAQDVVLVRGGMKQEYWKRESGAVDCRM